MTVLNIELLSRKAEAIRAACELLSAGNSSAANQLLVEEYRIDPTPKPPSNYKGIRIQEEALSVAPKRRAPSPRRLAELHTRDGYLDRYTGAPLVAPVVLKFLGHPEHGPLRSALPYHVNGGRGGPAARGARAVCHQAGFELFATYEHVRPLRVGGSDDLYNLVTCSVDVNYEKGTETWEPHDAPSPIPGWDGLTGWWLDFTEGPDFEWFRELRPLRAALLQFR